MHMAIEFVIRSPVDPSPDDRQAVGRIASVLDCSAREVGGLLKELVGAGVSNCAEVKTGAWFIEGFLRDQLAWDHSPVEGWVSRAVDRGVRRISIAPAAVVDGSHSYIAAMNCAAAWLKSTLRVFEQFGVALCLRPGEGRFLTSPLELRELIGTINSPALGVDLATQLPSGLTNWSDWFATLEPHVRSVCVEIDSGAEDAEVVSQVTTIVETLEVICKPRAYQGVITLCLRGNE